jgi:hypothetical protein
MRMKPQPKLARIQLSTEPITELRLSVPMMPHSENAVVIATDPQKTTGSTPRISRDMLPSPAHGRAAAGMSNGGRVIYQLAPASVNPRQAPVAAAARGAHRPPEQGQG